MDLQKHSLAKEFPDHHHTIRHLKMHDAHFSKLFESYHEVEHEVHTIEQNNSPVEDEYLETLKKRRLHLKDELLAMIVKAEDKL
jgi:uncharacterized protein YdcH (DUF465 family)